MNVQRGEVALIDYPFVSGSGSKVRPVLIVQNDRDNQRLTNTIVVQITSNTQRAIEPTQLLIEIATADGKVTGLRQDSVVNCINILTIDQARILRIIGKLPNSLLLKVNECLRIAFELP